ncbi:carboxypeptidase-like regulatory domain-containing protein [Vibrio cholerae]|uniref:carboxypeptidase-like regulatory domain-containing protein n=1 Tax=Vibrio cholerae TaxID=666 RepID=UPI00226F4481|nr:carboxypeptidase-like regulatory domain-containing protein [Vibrio cholerae]MCX9579864.1 carboxypeptidase regulatory-like domain-containing protein [Vibrio cholerae]
MPSIRVVGTLEDPTEGVGANAEIRIVSRIPFGSTTKGFNKSEVTDANGNYDFQLVYGQHLIAIKYENTSTYVTQGTVSVGDGSPVEIDLISLLLLSSTEPTPDLVNQLQEIAADAASSAGEAEQYKNDAQTSASEAAASAITAASNAAYIQALENISGSKWTIIIDDFGNSQIVRRIPIHTFEDLNITDCPFTGPLDCFIRQDLTLRPYVDVPVYLASNKGGKAVSQADKDPWTSINADTARARCAELNANSMMMSQEIWAMLCWNMISKGFQPRGNTEFGRSHSNKNEFGRRTDGRVPDDRAGSARTLTGTGPETWRHDGTVFGIADMVGNVWEWVDGMKMVNGQFVVADYTGQPEAEWSATGVYISETGQFTNVTPSTLNSSSQVWGSMTKASGYAGNERLQRLMIEPIACTSVLGGRFYWNLSGERFPFRGGYWINASGAGPAALHCGSPRSGASGNLGFRSAFVS